MRGGHTLDREERREAFGGALADRASVLFTGTVFVKTTITGAEEELTAGKSHWEL